MSRLQRALDVPGLITTIMKRATGSTLNRRIELPRVVPGIPRVLRLGMANEGLIGGFDLRLPS